MGLNPLVPLVASFTPECIHTMAHGCQLAPFLEWLMMPLGFPFGTLQNFDVCHTAVFCDVAIYTHHLGQLTDLEIGAILQCSQVIYPLRPTELW